ncbi:neuroligin-1-like [Topomyia yanbarensis]|uniref:neuroligin-1-like n=1 Tax=Topomyia yanbarensis TaxID=2498891 RepID=UPI00273C0221|nr:neuroligin-1-like [Topomyia yanbarensis]
MDLVAALHWLRENLSAFHGDPSRITLMGHGTGAALANILVVSPVASDLIHRVILLSGSALSPWAIQKDPLGVKKIVAEQTACQLDLVTDDLAPCLRTKPVSELLQISTENPRFLPGYAPFVDGTVIANSITANTRLKSLPTGSAITSTSGIEFSNFPTRELLFGLTSYESYNDLSAQDLEFGFNETKRDRVLRTYVRNIFHFHLKEIYSALRNEYMDWEHSPKNPLGHRDTILELLSDGHTAAPIVRLAYLHSMQKGNSYFLHFRHQTSERDFPQRGGSVRGEDVPFTFGLPLSQLFLSNYTRDDIKISRVLVLYFTNFAKTGNPNGLLEPHMMESSSNYPDKISNYNDYDIGVGRLQQSRSLMNNRKASILVSNRLISDTRNTMELYSRYESNRNHYGNRDESSKMASTASIGRGTLENDDDARDHIEKPAQKLEHWKLYDRTNQFYMELGCNAILRSHYRGHRLSMWLSLIPQLHLPDDSAYWPVRHHHFTEVKPEHYDGRVKDQQMLKLHKLITIARATAKPQKTEPIVVTLAQSVPKGPLLLQLFRPVRHRVNRWSSLRRTRLSLCQ